MAQPTSLTNIATNHFITIEQLSLHNETPSKAVEKTAVQPSPLLDTLPKITPTQTSMLLFVILFFCAIGMQFVQGIRGIKNFIVTIVVAFVIASIPFILDYAHTGDGQQVKAGPQETPKRVSVSYLNDQAAQVNWQTDIDASGGIRFGKAPFTAETSQFRIADAAQKTKTHTVVLDKLQLNQTYELEVLSGTNWYRVGDTYIRFTFTNN